MLRCRKYSRRVFCLGWLTFGFLGTAIRTRAKEGESTFRVAIPLRKIPKLDDLLGGVILKIRGRAVLLIRTAEDKVSALEPVCKHKACDVLYRKKWGEIRCDCHGSTYDVEGHVTHPPSTQDLTRYPARIEGERIILELPKEPVAG